MGELITTWSPYHGQCKTTATTLALASMKKNAIVTHIQPRMSNMENMCGFFEQNKNGAFEDSGFNNLIYGVMGRPITEEDVRAAIIQITDNMVLLPSVGQNRNDATRNKTVEMIITEILPKYFRYVFVDLGTEKSELAKNICAKAQTNYIILSQNKTLWKKYNMSKHDKYILSGYDKNSKFNARAFQWEMFTKPSIVPYCTEYADAISAGEVGLFFTRNENISNTDKNEGLADFFKALRGIK